MGWEGEGGIRQGERSKSEVELAANYGHIGLILTTSIFALPLALAAFPQRQEVQARTLEKEFWDRGGRDGKVEFNRGI